MKLVLDEKNLKWYGLFMDSSPRLGQWKGQPGIAIFDYNGPIDAYYRFWIGRDGRLVDLSSVECDRWLVKKDFSRLKAIPLFDGEVPAFNPNEWLYVEGKQYSELEVALRSSLIDDYKRDVLTAMRIIVRRYFGRSIDNFSLELMKKELSNQEISQDDINNYTNLSSEAEAIRSSYIQGKQAILETTDVQKIAHIFNYIKMRVGYRTIALFGKVYSPVEWKGNWSDGESYSVGDCVEHSGFLWRCLTEHVSSSDNGPPSDLWEVVFEITW